MKCGSWEVRVWIRCVETLTDFLLLTKFVAVLVRGGFTVKLMKKRHGPSLARAPSKALVMALVVCSHCHEVF